MGGETCVRRGCNHAEVKSHCGRATEGRRRGDIRGLCQNCPGRNILGVNSELTRSEVREMALKQVVHPGAECLTST